ncbi:MAG: proprotein convertase P-domain-containing protein, partial [Bacteroidota bacterium]
MNIDHTYLSDLSLYIQAPNGVYYLLCDDVGGTGNNFTGTCFSAVAAGVIPAPAVNAPYSGSYRPEGAGNNFGALNGSAINGTWTLWVGDQFAGDAGTLSSWSITLGNQNTFTYNWSPATGLSATNILNPTACPSSSTTYTLTVTNSCGCSTTATVPVTVLPPVTPTFNAVGPICSGSTPPTLPGTSNNGINGTWSPNVISNTASGTYTFTPAVGKCATTATLNVTVGNGLSLSTVTSNPVCFGGANGSITVSATGGAAPLTYVWNGSASTSSTASGLMAGTYTVTVTDANGCTGITNASLSSPSQLTSSSTSGNILCNGGTATATVTPSGGTSPYTYAWSPSGGSAATSTALTAGSYTCTITDANGCTTVRNITLTQPSALSATSTQGTIACNGGTATATVTPIGGTTPYTYAWSPSGGTAATSTALTAGSYTCTITDANGCTTVRNITLTQPSALSATSTQGTIACNGGTATATVTPSGGTSPYTYVWSPSGGSAATSTALTAGSYTCT